MDCLSSRRRLALLFVLLALVLACASAVSVWQWKVPSLVRQRLEAATGRRVTVGAVGLDWNLNLVLHRVSVAGAPPFDSQPAARVSRATIRLHGARGFLSPSEVSVDGLDIDLIATAEGDNLRGAPTPRTSTGSAGVRADRFAFPRITVRNARLRGSLALSWGPALALRASDADIQREGSGQWRVTLRHLVVDAQGMASVRASSVTVETARLGASVLSGTGISLEIPGGGMLAENLALDGTVALTGSTLDLHSNEAPDRQVMVTASWNQRFAELSATLRDLPLRALGALTGARTLGLENAKAALRAHVALDRPTARANFDLDASLVALDLLHPAVDTTPWRGLSASLSAQGQADLTSTRLEISEASIKALGATLRVRGFAEGLREPHGALMLFTPQHAPLSCPALLLGQPAPVREALAGLDLQGSLGIAATLGFDASAWQDLELDITIDPVCSVRSESRALADLLPVLRKPNTGEPPPGVKLAVGAFHPDFVPLGLMPPHLPSAFITSEDSRFFHHRGFDTDMIRHALAQDLANHSFDRGASTITQQLAKNLFLTHRRTLARKLEEAVLTWRLQKLLSKDRVLELYLNVIELGPGIRGVKQAARMYFGKDVGDLLPMESAHLAALAPNPHVLARRFRDGQIDEGWQQRLYDLLGMMKRHGRLSAEALATARTTRLELRDLGSDPSLQHQN
jgi:hypothetical protein